MTQSGKSFYVKHRLGSYQNRIIYDIKGEYAEYGLIVHSLKELAKAWLVDHCKRVVYIPRSLRIEEFEEFCRWVYEHVRNTVIIIDEVHAFCSKHKISYWFQKLISVGSGDPRFLGMILISQRGQNIHNDVLDNSKRWVIFQVSRTDAIYLSKKVSLSAEILETLMPMYYATYENYATVGNKVQFCTPIKV